MKENFPIKSGDMTNPERDEEKKYENIFKLLLFGQESKKDLNENSKLIIN